MKKIAFLIVFLIVATGCQTIPIQSPYSVNTTTTSQSNIETNKKGTFVYNPVGKEEFIFNEKAESLQKYGYDNFCNTTKTFACRNKLTYSKYVGTRGYFDSDKSVRNYVGYDFYPVILESGEKFFFVANEKFGGKYGHSSPIISYNKYKELKSFSRSPIVEGADIFLVDARISYGTKYYSLSNGSDISEKKLKLIREISSKYKNNSVEIAKLLLDLKINKDEVDYQFFISPTGDILRSEAKLYIGFNNTATWLRFKVKYYGDDWLFVKTFKVAADDYRWQSQGYEFKRDNSSGSVWEWIDIPANEKEIEVAKKLAGANKAVIRFQGSQYYSDQTLQNDQKEGIKTVLELYKLMRNQ